MIASCDTILNPFSILELAASLIVLFFVLGIILIGISTLRTQLAKQKAERLQSARSIGGKGFNGPGKGSGST